MPSKQAVIQMTFKIHKKDTKLIIEHNTPDFMKWELFMDFNFVLDLGRWSAVWKYY